MKTFRFELEEMYVAHVCDECYEAIAEFAIAYKEKRADYKQRVAKIAQVAIAQRDHEAWSYFTLLDHEIAREAGVEEQTIEAAHKSLQDKYGLVRIELRESLRTKVVGL